MTSSARRLPIQTSCSAAFISDRAAFTRRSNTGGSAQRHRLEGRAKLVEVGLGHGFFEGEGDGIVGKGITWTVLFPQVAPGSDRGTLRGGPR